MSEPRNSAAGLRRRALLNGVCAASLAAALSAPVQAHHTRIETVFNPATGQVEHVVEIISETQGLTGRGAAVVRTVGANGRDYIINTAQSVDEIFRVWNTDVSPARYTDYRVTVVNKDTHGNIVSFDVVDVADTSATPAVVTVPRVIDATTGINALEPAPGGGAGSGTSGYNFTLASGDAGVLNFTSVGANGSNGRAGGGYNFCIKFIGCAFIGVPSTGGGAGAPGGFINETVGSTTITVASDNLAGIIAISQGGSGGRGGNSYSNVAASAGGAGGAGGNVQLTSSANITTSGNGSEGILAQSLGGRGGDGGDGFILSSGGAGGVAAVQSGNVTVTNWGQIATSGANAIGITAQSLGGAAGNGGDSFGFVAQGGGGSLGGHGGQVAVNHNGSITTLGHGSHGILAQSIGGSGGNSGTAGGLAALASSGAGGGNGGNVWVSLGSGASIATAGLDARGIHAQSVGGGGGSAAFTAGVVALGGTGAAGGNGARVTVNTGSGSVITTRGQGADAIYAQSVGGGGGSGSSSGGLAALGGSGGGGGNGGVVTVNNAGALDTTGYLARGIFAQSLGGGGGTGGDSGGLASIGGSGSAASFGADVTVTNTGSIYTRGRRSVGIQAQSIGGGGGDGGSSGGAFLAVGGGGGAGGVSGQVTVTHGGDITTEGADAHAIFVQSVGGGGGNAGSATSASAFAGVAIGGAGGNGGNGGTAIANLTGGTLFTFGDRSRGLFIQSVGGGGGNGGFAIQSSFGYGAAASAAIGGRGGDGGLGGEVRVNGTVGIFTRGAMSTGILAESVGGGGGNGGFSIAFSGAAAGPGAAAFAASVGGSGGSGGAGGTVTMRAGGSITTAGDFSTGLVAQSVGGGGGNGGFSISVAAAGSGGGSGAVSASVGGFGGLGGAGGRVDALFSGAVLTSGEASLGGLFQSVGGGGGNGGFSIAGAGAFGRAASGAAAFGLGGFGGSGGNGGWVTGGVTGGVSTTGQDSTGVLVQSIGGGGGSGGFNVSGAVGGSDGPLTGSAALGMGGAGGGGGHGGRVDGFSGAISTTGDRSNGAVFQSIGGGGGTGGFSIAGSMSVTLNSSAVGTALGVTIGVGGAGGSGGSAGLVNGTVTGDVSTTGFDADGVIAQSVGGGGGSGGFNVSGNIAAAAGSSATLGLGVGGVGGSGGSSSHVNLVVTGRTDTRGDQAGALLAQSVGGGGGAGGFNVTGNVTLSANGQTGSVGAGVGGFGGNGGSAGTASLSVNAGVGDADGDLVAAVTTGQNSDGIIAQSVGGGGGNGGFNIAGGLALSRNGSGHVGLGTGGMGGLGGSGSAVSGTINGDVLTLGADSDGILLQSLGGGGGNGGFNVTGGITAAKFGSGNLLAGLGGMAGSGGSGGTVSGVIHSDVRTEGHRSTAILLQSLGGGGGNGGFNGSGGVSLSRSSGAAAGTLAFGVGGLGGGGGSASAVTGSQTGTVVTLGDQSHGVIMQSLGGGGGNGGLNVSGGITLSSGSAGMIAAGLGGFGGGGGLAGAVSASISGDVQTAGDQALAVLIQSLGGGGGSGGLNVSGGLSMSAGASPGVLAGLGVGGFGGSGGAGNSVFANVSGVVMTTGAGADAVTVQSLGGSGGTGGVNVSGGFALSNGSAGTGLIGVGGFGGGGGTASSASLVRTGETRTTGSNSDAIVVQSVGGGGGHGGVNVSGGVTVSSTGSATTLGFGLGGFGGGGGHAGNASAVVSGDVLASGLADDTIVEDETLLIGGGRVSIPVTPYRRRAGGSNGIVVQSIGGGGGAGGLNVSGGITASRAVTDAGRGLVFGLGGFGGSGGDAGTASLSMIASADLFTVTATGDNRAAIAVQSIGGGGGHGGLNVSGGVSTNGSVFAGIGGSGGGGGLGRGVQIDVDANLFAGGLLARGLLAQSIGGGGGNGGLNVSGGIVAGTGVGSGHSINFALGGAGGSGNQAGAVQVEHDGQIMVDGVGSTGLLAQSIGGGGGAGGLNVSAAVNLASDAMVGTVAIGGSGGTGSDAADVTVVQTGDIFINAVAVTDPQSGETRLEAARFTGGSTGLLAQSIGGGGGASGMNFAGSVAATGQPFTFNMGGSGGAAGDAGNVSITRGWVDPAGSRTAAPGRIQTFGHQSSALVAQSIGGGGGHADLNLGVSLSTDATSQGGSAATATLTVGGDGGAAGQGGRVMVDHNGILLTDGDHSYGILAKSVGGGGGHASFNLGVGYLRDSNNLAIAIGGSPTSAGAGGAVSVDHEGYIGTAGRGAIGVLAQSIGGGGGNAIINTDIPYLDALSVAAAGGAANQFSFALGRRGGTGGEGGQVDVDVDGRIFTTGNDAAGVVATSLGGGGGRSSSTSFGVSRSNPSGTEPVEEYAFNLAVSVGLEGGTGARGGNVNVSAAGTIETRGRNARGIEASSIGGGGGRAGNAFNLVPRANVSLTIGVGGAGGTGAVSGDVSVNSSAGISTFGDGSDGILAEAIGGGGGQGGASTAATNPIGLSPESGQQSNTVAVNVGGNGGSGATGGAVLVTNTGIITTEGREAAGIRAISQGGGGGRGGYVLNLRGESRGRDQDLTINVGGSGSSGAAGGAVQVTNEGTIVTQGDAAVGIQARSIGGGGGSGGGVYDITIETSVDENLPGNSNRLAVNVGGSGGTGATGGDVTVINRRVNGVEHSGIIQTGGAGAHGIQAESIGGGGGDGGAVLSLSRFAGGEGHQIGLSLGGSGDSGGSGGQVSVTNEGSIRTSGDGAHGIYARSLGGGGGDGAVALSVDGTTAGRFSGVGVNPMIAIGGFGGDGGQGGAVTVNNSGSIFTHGRNAHGILAQSIGGGGGNAALGISLAADAASILLSNSVSALLGNFGGGQGGTGGRVTVNQTGDIVVTGRGSQAIQAESLNGGGGNLVVTLDGLGLDRLASLPADKTPNAAASGSADFSLVLGGQSAQDMAAADTSLVSTGLFGAAGDFATGINLRSIGGGGGLADLEIALANAQGPSASAMRFAFDLGGQAGARNRGGHLGLTHAGHLTAVGGFSTAAILQSVGGGGGRLNFDLTAPQDSHAGNLALQLGAANGQDNTSGRVSAGLSGAIVTSGDFASGLVAQSLGGGGGLAQVRVDAVDPAALDLTATLGGDAETNANGADISLIASGGVMTTGDRALGLVGQSVGGGGGIVMAGGVPDMMVQLGGRNGTQGDAGDVSLTNDGVIQTRGARAHGVVLQSIGGGGGLVMADAGTVRVNLSDGNTGSGGAITFNQSGDVVTAGDGAFGIILQSLGGGGGWVDGQFAGASGGAGTGGAISFFVDGMIFAAGEDATALFAQSSGRDGGGDIIGRLTGLLRGGSGEGHGLWMDGGASNQVHTSGSISAVSGQAITAGAGDDLIINTGTVIGNIDLGGGVNGFDNQEGATFLAFSTIDLRDPSVSPQAPQAGTAGRKTPVMEVQPVEPVNTDKAPVMEVLSAAGPDRSEDAPQSAAIPALGLQPVKHPVQDAGIAADAAEDGHSSAVVHLGAATFRNGGTFLMGLSASTYPLDLLNGDTFSHLDDAGDPTLNLLFGSRVINTVELDGHFEQSATGHLVFDIAFGPYASDRVNVTGSARVAGTGDVTLTWLEDANPVTLFATRDGAGQDLGLEITDTMAVDYSIAADAEGVHLQIATAFGLPSLTSNQRSLGRHMDAAVRVGGSSGIGRLLAWLGNMQSDELALYEHLFAELDPEPHLAPLHSQLVGANRFADELFNCGGPVSTPDDACVWSRLEMSERSRDAGPETLPVSGQSMSFSGGFEQRLNDDWSVAAGISYENTQRLTVDGQRAQSSGEGFSAGIGVERHHPRGIYAGVSASLGWSWFETERAVNVFTPGVGSSAPETGHVRLDGHVGTVHRRGPVFVRPQVSASLTALHHAGLVEDGLDGLGVEVLSDTQLSWALHPQATMGFVFRETEDMVGTISVTGGIRLSHANQLDLPIRLLGANPAATPARIGTTLDPMVRHLGIDIEVAGNERLGLSIGYDGEFGETTEHQRAGIDFRLRF